MYCSIVKQTDTLMTAFQNPGCKLLNHAHCFMYLHDPVKGYDMYLWNDTCSLTTEPMPAPPSNRINLHLYQAKKQHRGTTRIYHYPKLADRFLTPASFRQSTHHVGLLVHVQRQGQALGLVAKKSNALGSSLN